MDMYGAKASKMGSNKKQSAAKKKIEAQKGMHKMPDGTMMKNSAMKKGNR
jgi:hypothetical protein